MRILAVCEIIYRKYGINQRKQPRRGLFLCSVRGGVGKMSFSAKNA